jgi:hypothetical protein
MAIRAPFSFPAAVLLLASVCSAEIHWSVSSRQESGVQLIRATAHNRGTQPAPLGRFKLHETELPLRPEAVALVMSGWQGPSLVKPLRGADPLLGKTLVQLTDGQRSFQAAFLTFDRVATEHLIRWDPQRGTAIVASYCDFAGYLLAPGAHMESETLRLDGRPDPYAALEAWADAVAAHYRPALWPKMPAGWVGWSWVDGFNVESYEDVVHRNARAIRRQLPGFDLDYIWVSLGNLEARRPGNWLKWNYKLFPGGVQALTSYLGQLNFKLGLWAGAYWLNSGLPDYQPLKDAVLQRGGQPITVPSSQWGTSYVLDPTHPKTKAHIASVFQTYRQWGIRYFMIDFLDAIGDSTPGTYRPDGFHDRSLIPGPQTFREGLKTIRQAAGADTYLLSSTGPTLQGIGLVNAARVGTDYGEGRPLDGPGKGFYPGTFSINNAGHWTSHRRATGAWASHWFMHRKLFLADSGNVLTIDKPVALADAEISATIFGLNGGPLMLGDDIDRMDPSRLEMLRQLFPRLPETGRPLDLFTSPDPGYPKVFHLRVRKQWDTWDLVAVFNYGKEPLRQRIDFARLGWEAGGEAVVWDHWAGKYLGAHAAAFEGLVPPESVKLWRISERRSHPWLLSTDMHVRQGQDEIESCRWDDTARTLTIRARRPAGLRGNVFLSVPKGVALAEPLGLWIARDANDSTLVVRCPFDFAAGTTVQRSIRF